MRRDTAIKKLFKIFLFIFFDRYSPIPVESAQFGANQAELMQIREKKEKKKKAQA